MELRDRVAWITGAGRRLGRAMALHLARAGAHVVVHYHTSEDEAREVADTIESLGRRALPVRADLCSPAEIAAAADRIGETFGRLDVLVNSASTFLRQPLMQVTEADWHRSIDVNLKGAFFCAQAAARLMQANAGGPLKGKIVNITDSAAMRPYRNHLPYMVAKAGLITMTEAMALELAPSIHVNAIAPGVVLPPEMMGEEERRRALEPIPLDRFGAPEDVLAALDFLLTGSDYVTGLVVTVDGGRLIANFSHR